MNVLGFLATIIICGTVIAVTWLLCKVGIKLNKTYKDNTVITKPNSTPIKYEDHPVKVPANKDELEKELNKSNFPGMDTIIQAANKLMGVDTAVEVNNEGK